MSKTQKKSIHAEFRKIILLTCGEIHFFRFAAVPGQSSLVQYAIFRAFIAFPNHPLLGEPWVRGISALLY